MGSRWVRAAGAALLVAALAPAGCDSPPASSSPSSPVSSAAALPRVGEDLAAGPVPTRPKVSRETLDSFLTIALGTEYGDNDPTIAMWELPIVVVHLSGTLSAAGRTCATRTVADFNALSATTKLRITSGPGDIELHVAPRSQFATIEPHYVPGNDGFAWVTWPAGTNAIGHANVLVQSTGISARLRCHLIRRELTQAMGLLGDLGNHPTSVFTDDKDATPTQYSALDKQMIKLLYSGAIHPHDDRPAVTRAVTVS
jgi:hypothetical protein